MDKKIARSVIDALSHHFTDKPALSFDTDYQLLVAVILSAQCTDERVNKVTERLFVDYGTPEKMLTLSVDQLASKIFSCGLYRSKAEHILSATKSIVEDYGGEVPRDLDKLRSLAGVGRKTANVVASVAFGVNAIAVDTHVFRVANRLGLCNEKNVLKTEYALMNILDEKDWRRAHHYLIYLGRKYCSAKKPNCGECPVKDFCENKKG